ncbi:unnamed protein product [Paramecium pentaurelia]|uniref:Uncharacterized protein n=1 Tax=Paramecium pentaurelia TaxID=43138 RepID=A0A8S1SF05_9CILI|nr:unnamed protein product [Paramecium pentaurelia]
MNLMICRINSLIIRMDDYDEFSDNSIEIVLNQFQGKASHQIEENITIYLKKLGLKMKTNPLRKQLKYEKENNQIIDILTSRTLSSYGNTLKEKEIDYCQIIRQNPLLLRNKKQSQQKIIKHQI